MIDENAIKNTMGIVVRELRIEKNLTQEKLAEYLDLQAQTITAIENGKTFISCEVLTKLCNFFEVEPAVFFTKRVRHYTEADLNYISEIKRQLAFFPPEKLKEIHDILLVMHNNLH